MRAAEIVTVLMLAQNQAWLGPPSYLEAKLTAQSAHLCPKKLEGEEKPQQGEAPQPQGRGDTGTSAGERLHVKDFMATTLPHSFCCHAQGAKLAVRVPHIQCNKGSKQGKHVFPLFGGTRHKW